MRTSRNDRQRNPVLSGVIMVCVGIAMAMLFYQCDHTISTVTRAGAWPHTTQSRDMIVMSFHMARLQADRLTAAVNRVVRVK